ncbi:MAG: ribose 5-phosphate isomerase B [Helicobacteraceae bacterium]|nr:ribose 5-phosphate isomerase B [Helicobacteraceae bacterium]
MQIFLASDHAGVGLKSIIIEFLKELEIESINLGPNNTDRVDYPDFADALCENILNNEGSLGILICGSGIGMSIAANRYSGIRAALCNEPLSAKLAREHNDANVLCLGARLIGEDMACEIVKSFLDSTFAGGRHALRVKKLR